MHFQPADLQGMSRFYRANLINCLSGHKPAVLVGTANAEGQTNLALFSNIFHMGADPALLGYVQRPVGQSGDSFRNIMATGVYTFNLVPHEWLERAHQTSARYAADQSEFEACDFDAEWIDGFAAPFVKGSPVRIGLQLADTIPYPRNGTTLVIGAVAHVLVEPELLMADGNINFDEAGILSVAGLEQYFLPRLLRQMPYAKAEQPTWNR